jgi:hypothetical protein
LLELWAWATGAGLVFGGNIDDCATALDSIKALRAVPSINVFIMDLPPWLDDSKSPSPREWDLLGRDCLPHLNKPAKGAVPCVSPLLLQLIFELTAVIESLAHARSKQYLQYENDDVATR